MDEILKRLEAGLYQEIRIYRYTVTCDSKAQRKGLPYWGVASCVTEEYINDIRFEDDWEASNWATLMNNQEGPLVIDVETDIRTLLSLISELGGSRGRDSR